jgi:hypothetical protein
MRLRVVCWLVGGAALLVSFTNELVGTSAHLASGLQHLRASGPIGLNAVAFMTSVAGRVLLLMVALLFLQQAGKDASGRPTLKSVTVRALRFGWRAVRRRLVPTAATQVTPARRGITSIAVTASPRSPNGEGS